MKHILLLITFLLLPLPCFARLGETKEQLDARYGKSFQLFDVPIVLEYESNGYSFIITMVNDKAALMVVKKNDGSEFSDLERITFLERSCAGKGFKKTDTPVPDLWIKDVEQHDSKSYAIYAFRKPLEPYNSNRQDVFHVESDTGRYASYSNKVLTLGTRDLSDWLHERAKQKIAGF
jgi:hypothetical protein